VNVTEERADPCPSVALVAVVTVSSAGGLVSNNHGVGPTVPPRATLSEDRLTSSWLRSLPDANKGCRQELPGIVTWECYNSLIRSELRVLLRTRTPGASGPLLISKAGETAIGVAREPTLVPFG